MCIAGSVVIVIHAPQERAIASVQEIWTMATQTGMPEFIYIFASSLPSWCTSIRMTTYLSCYCCLGYSSAFLLYVASVIVIVFVLVFHFAPLYGNSNVLIFTGICSLMGSLSVMFLSSIMLQLMLAMIKFEWAVLIEFSVIWNSILS